MSREKAKSGNLSKRLEQLREFLSLKQESFAKNIGIAYRTYVNYASGKDPSSHVLVKTVEVFGVSPIWLLTGQGSMFPEEPKERPRPLVPILGQIEAGHDGRLLLENVEYFIPLPLGHDEEADNLGVSTHLLGFEVTGLSMYPQYRQGEVVLCSRKQPIKADDDVVVQLVGGDSYCKVWRPSGETVILQSYNKEFDPITVGREAVVDIVKVVDSVWGWRARQIRIEVEEYLQQNVPPDKWPEDFDPEKARITFAEPHPAHPARKDGENSASAPRRKSNP